MNPAAQCAEAFCRVQRGGPGPGLSICGAVSDGSPRRCLIQMTQLLRRATPLCLLWFSAHGSAVLSSVRAACEALPGQTQPLSELLCFFAKTHHSSVPIVEDPRHEQGNYVAAHFHVVIASKTDGRRNMCRQGGMVSRGLITPQGPAHVIE